MKEDPHVYMGPYLLSKGGTLTKDDKIHIKEKTAVGTSIDGELYGAHASTRNPRFSRLSVTTKGQREFTVHGPYSTICKGYSLALDIAAAHGKLGGRIDPEERTRRQAEYNKASKEAKMSRTSVTGKQPVKHAKKDGHEIDFHARNESAPASSHDTEVIPGPYLPSVQQKKDYHTMVDGFDKANAEKATATTHTRPYHNRCENERASRSSG